MLDLGQHQVGRDRLESLFYIPDFVSIEQEAALLREVAASRQQWREVSGVLAPPRLRAGGSGRRRAGGRGTRQRGS